MVNATFWLTVRENIDFQAFRGDLKAGALTITKGYRAFGAQGDAKRVLVIKARCVQPPSPLNKREGGRGLALHAAREQIRLYEAIPRAARRLVPSINPS